jgi:hypothetical protein
LNWSVNYRPTYSGVSAVRGRMARLAAQGKAGGVATIVKPPPSEVPHACGHQRGCVMAVVLAAVGLTACSTQKRREIQC